MLHHVVLMSFKEDLAPEVVLNVMRAIRALQRSIPQIKSYTEGLNCSTEGLAKGFTHGFTILFENSEDRDSYLIHPEHVRVANELIVPNLKNGLDSVIVFDYIEQVL